MLSCSLEDHSRKMPKFEKLKNQPKFTKRINSINLYFLLINIIQTKNNQSFLWKSDWFDFLVKISVFTIFVNSATTDWKISLLMHKICFEMTSLFILNSLFSDAINVWNIITIRTVVQDFLLSVFLSLFLSFILKILMRSVGFDDS